MRYTIRQAAKQVGLTYGTLRQYTWRGVVETVTDSGGHIWITQEELQRLMTRDLPPTARKIDKKVDMGRPIGKQKPEEKVKPSPYAKFATLNTRKRKFNQMQERQYDEKQGGSGDGLTLNHPSVLD